MMEQFTRKDLYSAFDTVYSNLRFIKLYLQDAVKNAQKDGFNLQVESIQEDLDRLEDIENAIVNLENNY